MTRAEWRRAAGLGGVILLLHAVGFLALVGGAVAAGVGVTAYVLGLRHAFDADHIGAIDNTTRKLMDDGQRPLSVGFFFALGHSTIVLALGVLVVVGVRGLDGAIQDDGSALNQTTGLIGPVVSGTFLLLIGLLNLAAFVGIARIVRRMRDGAFDDADLQVQLDNRGVMTRFYRRATRAVRKPWHMYPLGCLFGLGFDTATEVALLATAGAGAASGMPFYAVLALPVLFAAGMVLFDTLDGAFMNFAYGWSLSQPVRKVFYNLTITGLSVLVALGVGGITLLLRRRLGRGRVRRPQPGRLRDRRALRGDVRHRLTVWRFGRIEERWSTRVEA